MALHHNPRIVTSGLVLALDAGDTNSYPGSGTTWKDLSGNSNNGTLTNGVTLSSATQGSFIFGGTNQYIELDNALALTGAFTITCFFVRDTTGERSFLGKTSGGSGTKIIFLSNNNIFFRMVDGESAVNFDIGYTNDLHGQWNYLTAIRDSSNVIKASMNGGPLITNAARTGTFSPNAIGRNGDGQYWDGKIADMKVYNRELTASEIEQNYEAQKTRFGL